MAAALVASTSVSAPSDTLHPEASDGAPLGLLYVPKLAASLDGLWSPAFPPADLLGAAAGMFTRAARWDGREGPRARVVIGPGCVAVERRDPARATRTAERAVKGRRLRVDVLAASIDPETGHAPEAPASRQVVTAWSRGSRANMVRALCELDYSALLVADRVPALVTLTLPGDWLTVAPDGAAFKRHLWAFRRRYSRAWGGSLVAVWKLEFQRRGAPHAHLLMVPPHGVAGGDRRSVGVGRAFRQWLSEVWADIVAHPDPEERQRHLLAGTGVDFSEGLRASDPKRVAVYFTKHNSFAAKGYQHVVPEEWREPGKGPGRFWGYWGLQRTTAAVEVPEDQAVMVVRTLRRWAAAQGVTRERRVVRGTQSRKVRRPVRRMVSGAGWVSVNDGAAMAAQLARCVEVCRA